MKNASSSRLRYETDFFRASNNQLVSRERRIRSVQLRGFHVLGLLVLVVSLSWFSKQAADFLLHWDRLTVRHFHLTQAPAEAADRLGLILSRFRSNILAVDLDELEHSLLELPQVRAVSISRVLPSTLRIDFELRQPRFQRQQGKAWQVLDGTGRAIGRADAPQDGLTIIRSTAAEDVESLMALGGEVERIRHPIEYVAFRPPYGLEVKLRDQGELFYPGGQDVAAKIERYLSFRPRLGAEVERVQTVDLRLDHRILLGMKPTDEAVYEK